MKLLLKFLLLICLTGCGSQKDEFTLIVGTNAEYPPFTYVDGGKIIGYDIDVIHAVASKLGKKIVLKDMPFTALVAELQFGQIDVIAAGMSPTPERAKRVLFTKPYLDGDELVMVSLKNSPVDTLGKVAIVNEGYKADIYLTEESVELIRLAAPADAFLALDAGRAPIFVTAQSTVQNYPGASKYHVAELGESDSIALAVEKNNTVLLEEIQKALDELEETGTLDIIKKKWKL